MMKKKIVFGILLFILSISIIGVIVVKAQMVTSPPEQVQINAEVGPQPDDIDYQITGRWDPALIPGMEDIEDEDFVYTGQRYNFTIDYESLISSEWELIVTAHWNDGREQGSSPEVRNEIFDVVLPTSGILSDSDSDSIMDTITWTISNFDSSDGAQQEVFSLDVIHPLSGDPVHEDIDVSVTAQYGSTVQLSDDQHNLDLYAVWPGQPSIKFTAVPEKRIPATGNDGTKAVIEVRVEGADTAFAVFEDNMGVDMDTDVNGRYDTWLALTGVIPGRFDVVVKGYSHLKKLKNVVLYDGEDPANDIDFTDAGSDKLLIGDVHSSALEPHGNNVVNSMDITYMVSKWNVSDAGVSDEKADADENGLVNSLDVTKLVNNFAVEGD